jgi:hypothetical protein
MMSESNAMKAVNISVGDSRRVGGSTNAHAQAKLGWERVVGLPFGTAMKSVR